MTAAYALRVSQVLWGRLLLSTLAVESLLLLGHFLYMVVFSHWIRPGQEIGVYQAHAQSSGPYFVIIAGGPLSCLVVRAALKHAATSPALSTSAGVLLLLLAVDLGFHALLDVSVPPIAPVAWAAKWLGVIAAAYTIARKDWPSSPES